MDVSHQAAGAVPQSHQRRRSEKSTLPLLSATRRHAHPVSFLFEWDVNVKDVG